MSDLPVADHSIMFGYYYDISGYGDVRPEILSTVDTVLNWAYIMNGDLTLLNQSFASYVGLGKNIIFGPDFNINSDTVLTPAALASLDVAAPYWDSVTAIFFDEPSSSFTKTSLEAFITSWHNAESARGLANKPVIINFTSITGPGSWQANNIDYVGFEAYMPPANQNDPDIVDQLNDLIDATLAFTGSRNVFITIQGYDRNGDWTNITSLRDIQLPPYLKAYNNRVVQGLLVFSYGRNDPLQPTHLDTRTLPPCIRTEHLRIWNAINGDSQPAEISCSAVVEPIYFYQSLTCGTFCKQLNCAIANTLSGLYRLVPNQRGFDNLYSTIIDENNFTTIQVPIEASIKTSLLGD